MHTAFKTKAIEASTKVGKYLLTIIILLHLGAWFFNGSVWFYSHAFAVDRLSAVFSVLKENHIVRYRNQDWCKVLEYQKGVYWCSTNPSTCALDPDKKSVFDREAEAVFSALSKRLLLTGVRVIWIVVEYDDSGEISYAEFALAHFSLSYFTYIYNPLEPPSRPEVIKNLLIKPGWYFVVEDWM